MSYIHTIITDRKTGKIIDYKVAPSDIVINHRPLCKYLLERLEKSGVLSKLE